MGRASLTVEAVGQREQRCSPVIMVDLFYSMSTKSTLVQCLSCEAVHKKNSKNMYERDCSVY